MNWLQNRLQQQLHQRQQKGTLRSLRLSSGIDFFSNDYLGLATDAEVLASQQAFIGRYKGRAASTGSRLLSGNSQLAHELEEELANYFQAEAALFFSSGYAANLALISALAQQGDLILYDSLIHASMRDGYRLSFATRKAFAHNNLTDLEQKLQQAASTTSGNIFVLAEAVYSMDGDQAPLPEMLILCQQYKAALLFDEAHSTGLFGPKGEGLAVELGLAAQLPVRVITFGKAIGAHGACVLGSKVLCQFLVNFGRSFIYSTAPPAHTLLQVQHNLRWLAAHPQHRQQLQQVVKAYKAEAAAVGQNCQPGAIQTLILPGETAKQAEQLLQPQFNVRAIVAPTVAVGSERLRICLHSFNTAAQVRELFAKLSPLLRELKHRCV